MNEHRKFLDMAARLAIRGLGRVEPNPPVGCVFVRDGVVIGAGHHRRYGDLHAERDALRAMKHQGIDPAGSTAYVTLEPCNGHGKQPPCVDALIEAKVARVIFASRDPNPAKSHGAEALERAGITAEFSDASSFASGLVAPFIKRLTQGLPWVIAKWAQTIDGRIATRTGESKWISNEWSRRRVHELRSRVDAVVTGVGTVTADDPMLNARCCHVRRVARRVIIDSDLHTPLNSKIIRTASEIPTTVFCGADVLLDESRTGSVEALRAFEVEVRGAPRSGFGTRLDLEAVLRDLVSRYHASNVMIESGPGLLGSFFEADLIDAAQVYIAPMLIGDELAHAAAGGRNVAQLSDARRFELRRLKSVGGDIEAVYRRLR